MVPRRARRLASSGRSQAGAAGGSLPIVASAAAVAVVLAALVVAALPGALPAGWVPCGGGARPSRARSIARRTGTRLRCSGGGHDGDFDDADSDDEDDVPRTTTARERRPAYIDPPVVKRSTLSPHHQKKLEHKERVILEREERRELEEKERRALEVEQWEACKTKKPGKEELDRVLKIVGPDTEMPKAAKGKRSNLYAFLRHAQMLRESKLLLEEQKQLGFLKRRSVHRQLRSSLLLGQTPSQEKLADIGREIWRAYADHRLEHDGPARW